MPHRPERNGGAATNADNTASSVYSSHMTAERAAHIMRPTAGSYYPAGVVTPMMTSTPWIASHSGIRGRVSSIDTPKSSDSTDRSTGTKQDEDSTVATLATEASAEELEKRETTVSALLLVSTQGVRHDVNNTEHADQEKESTSSNVPESSNVPLKKRKKHLDFLRRNEGVGPICDPCHISPVSHSSTGSNHVEGRTISHEEVTPDRPRRITAPAQRSNYYDSKESAYQQQNKDSTQALLDSSKIHSTTDIALPAHLVMSHFPSVLHRVLSDPEYSGTVLKWLPDGEAWKVLRWDALRRQVLPRYFSDLRDENGTGCGTIDAFLWHLTAWGFEDIKDGTDVGAYKHEVCISPGDVFGHHVKRILTTCFSFASKQLFIRGAQKLCSKMRFTTVPSSKGPKTVSPGRVRKGDAERSILQVPSLAESDSSKCDSPHKRARYEDQASAMSSTSTVRSPGPLNWAIPRPQDSSMLIAYRSEDPYSESAAAWGHYYSDAARMRQMAGQYGGPPYDPRFRHIGADPMMSPVSQYSPPQVRSGRGAIRISASNRSSVSSSPATTPTVRTSFSVSNRGKGRKATACRTSIPIPDGAKSAKMGGRDSPSESAVSLEEAQRIGSAVQGVAIAVSRKTKRKLPLARKTDTASAFYAKKHSDIGKFHM
jgi:hypothetical protein